jgi:hypothetical protein
MFTGKCGYCGLDWNNENPFQPCPVCEARRERDEARARYDELWEGYHEAEARIQKLERVREAARDLYREMYAFEDWADLRDALRAVDEGGGGVSR